MISPKRRSRNGGIGTCDHGAGAAFENLYLIPSHINLASLDSGISLFSGKEVKLKNKILRLAKRYGNYVGISSIFDKNMITSYKAGPLDEGVDKFLQLYKERIIL